VSPAVSSSRPTKACDADEPVTVARLKRFARGDIDERRSYRQPVLRDARLIAAARGELRDRAPRLVGERQVRRRLDEGLRRAAPLSIAFVDRGDMSREGSCCVGAAPAVELDYVLRRGLRTALDRAKLHASRRPRAPSVTPVPAARDARLHPCALAAGRSEPPSRRRSRHSAGHRRRRRLRRRREVKLTNVNKAFLAGAQHTKGRPPSDTRRRLTVVDPHLTRPRDGDERYPRRCGRVLLHEAARRRRDPSGSSCARSSTDRAT